MIKVLIADDQELIYFKMPSFLFSLTVLRFVIVVCEII